MVIGLRCAGFKVRIGNLDERDWNRRSICIYVCEKSSTGIITLLWNIKPHVILIEGVFIRIESTKRKIVFWP